MRWERLLWAETRKRIRRWLGVGMLTDLIDRSGAGFTVLDIQANMVNASPAVPISGL
jgi:hypothetical protein